MADLKGKKECLTVKQVINNEVLHSLRNYFSVLITSECLRCLLLCDHGICQSKTKGMNDAEITYLKN